MSQDANYDFLGTGWSFPPSFNPVSGDVVMTSSVEDIRASLEILLSTTIGERLMQPGYGCKLNELIFEPLTINLVTYLNSTIRDAITRHEPRIKTDKVDIDSSNYLEGMVRVEVAFTIPATNTRYNFVYPYYLNEGSGIKR
ncbi:MAG: GPW/gp25 family protein [Bacteroidia bacterium]